MTTDNITAIERLGMIVFGVLVIVGLPILGFLNTVGGSMSAMIAYAQGEETGHALTQAGVPEGAKITAQPIFGPNLRATVLAVAIIVLALIAIYRLSALSGQSAA